MLSETRLYKIIAALCISIMVIWIYFNHESVIINYMSGRFIPDIGLFWNVGVAVVISISVLFLTGVAAYFRNQNEILKKYMEEMQNNLDKKDNNKA